MILIGAGAVAMGVAFLVGRRIGRADPRGGDARARNAEFMLAHSNDMLTRLSVRGVREFISPASLKILGYTPEELLAATPIAHIHPEDRVRAEMACKSLLEGVVTPTCTYRQQHRDGHYVTLEASYSLIAENGVPTGVAASTRDISHRAENERAYSRLGTQMEERGRLLEMAESMAKVGHWRLNVANGDVTWSPEMYRIHGVIDDAAPNSQAGLQFYHPDDIGRVLSLIEHSKATGEPWRFDARIVRPSGETRWIASHGQVEKAVNGEIVGIFGVFQDITERIETLQALVDARDQAQQALSTRSAFVATMSHEVRTPLTSILATVSLLQGARSDVEQARYLEILERSCAGLSAIVDDVLVHAKLDEAEIELDTTPFDVAQLVRDAVTMVQAEGERKSVVVEASVPPGRHIVGGDVVRVQRVLTNLVSNALKFTPAGRITVGLRQGEDAMWHFTVRDTGVGIDPARIGRVFEPFMQADPSITRQYGGTGLGLSICKTLVEAMGGTIGVESTPGQGSEFRFDLPLPAVAEAPPAAVAADPLAGVSLNILLAEDNGTNRFLISELLQRLGQRVVTVGDGAEAVDRLMFRYTAAGEQIDLVLMDVHMPVLDGIAATRAIRAQPGPLAQVPIFAITADISSERLTELREAGVTGVLGKPVKLDELRRVLTGVGGAATRDDAASPPHAPEDDDVVLDMGRLRDFDNALGPQARNTLIGLLIDDLGRSPTRIRALRDAGQLDLVREETHALRGAVVGVGGQRLVRLLSELDAETLTGTVPPATIDRIDSAAEELKAALGKVIAA